MKAGERLGNYEIVAPLGAGAMGEVYRARDLRLGRDVAVKFLSPGLGDSPEAFRRFEHEARTLASLNHPNVAVLHGFEDAAGRHFLVMELVEGEPLDRRLGGRALETSTAIVIAAQIADALDAAHKRGIVHRDLKPANVMIGRHGEVKLLDFGVSKFLGDVPPDATTQMSTAVGAVIGTVPYMSPEQVSGGEVDHRTDVWSFGCVLYEMLTGVRPFAGPTPAATAAAILSQPPAFDRLPRDLPPTIRGLLERSLEKDVNDRLSSLTDVGPALRHRSPAPRPRRVSRAAVLATAIVATLALLAVMPRLRRDNSPAPAARPTVTSIAVLPLANDSPGAAEDYFVDGMTDALINDLAALNLWKVISRTSVMQYRSSTKPLPVIARELGVDAVIEGSVLRAGARVRISARLLHAATEQPLWSQVYERDMTEILTLQREVARSVATGLRGRLAPEVDRRLGGIADVDPETHLLVMKGRHLWNERTPASLQEAIRHFESALQRDAHYAPALAGLAESYVLLPVIGSGWRPADAFPRGIDYARRAIQKDNSLAGAHAALAYSALFWEWDWATAEREFEQAIQLNPSYANAYFWNAVGLASRGRTAEAVSRAGRAVELDPVSPIITAGLGWMYHFDRKDDDAIRVMTPVLELNPRFRVLHYRLGIAHRHQGAYARAIEHLERALEESNADTLAELAVTHAAAGNRAEARALLRQLEQRARKEYVSAYARAIVHLALDERARALDWLEKAAEERSWYLPFIAVDPDLDPLRGDPRFQRLLGTVGLAGVKRSL